MTIHHDAQRGDINRVAQELRNGTDINSDDGNGNTPLMWAVMAPEDNSAMVRYLIEQGANVKAVNNFGFTILMEAAENGNAKVVRLLLEAGAPADYVGAYGKTAVDSARTVEIVRLLVAAGGNLNDINNEVHQRLLGLDARGGFGISQEKFLEGRHRRFGQANPEVMKIEFWEAMVRSGISAYSAQSIMGQSYSQDGEPVWCFDRFGRTITELPDGRFVEIGGEHEDSYDPDFCIYNDVVVHHGDGTFQILGYPRHIFPPTDFHTATLVGGDIYIIGGLGYWGMREYGQTPVYQLNCATWHISKVETSGQKPGWINRHRAVLRDEKLIYISGGKLSAEVDQKEAYVDNTSDYTLDLTTMRWMRLG